MNKTLADRWVTALRSGAYKQGQGYLNNDGKFCCLGVLCDVAGVPRELAPTEDASKMYKYGGSPLVLYKNVQKAVGVRSTEGLADVEVRGVTYTSLADANDKGVSFADFADWIEQNWEKL